MSILDDIIRAQRRQAEYIERTAAVEYGGAGGFPGGIIPVANGGTGIASYTIGDILYASGATTLSKLADVATGNALISGGIGVAPAWGKIGLTTHVSGVLPIANGGTNSSTALSGSTIMISNGSAIVQGAAGTTTTVLHGNAAGAPTYSAVSLTADVSGILPAANGGTGVSNAGTITNASNTTITGGGTLALGGFTLTVPATGTAVLGTGANTRIAYWSGTNTLTSDANFVWNAASTTVRMSGTAPGFWIDETDGGAPKGALFVLDGSLFQIQRRATGFGAFEATVFGMDINAPASSIRVTAAGAIGLGGVPALTTAGDVQIFANGSITGNLAVGLANLVALATLHLSPSNATTGAVDNIVIIGHNSSGTAVAGFGSGIVFQLESSTTINQESARVTAEWATATHATRAGKGKLTAYYTSTERECIAWGANATVPLIGFHGSAPVAQDTGWSISNVTTDRVYDANSTTLDEIADVLGTLINYLKTRGDLGA